MSEAPGLRVVSGRPDDAELAALVTVLLAASRTAAPAPAPAPRPLWGDPATLVRRAGPTTAGWAGPLR